MNRSRAVWVDDKTIKLLYNPFAFPSYRKAALKRDKFTCLWCGEPATTVDHIIPSSKGGTDLPRNLLASCGYCNTKRGNRSARSYLLERVHDVPNVTKLLYRITTAKVLALGVRRNKGCTVRLYAVCVKTNAYLGLRMPGRYFITFLIQSPRVLLCKPLTSCMLRRSISKRNGKFSRTSDRQRYLCKSCGRTFTDFAGTPLAYVKKPSNLWAEVARCMREGMSCIKTATELGIAVLGKPVPTVSHFLSVLS